MKQSFSKPALAWEQQVELLQQRGMLIEDPKQAEFYLTHLNYYRLVGYTLPFEADHATHRFAPGTTFADVLNLYIFDRELRPLVLDAIERVEVSARSRWAYEIAHRHGPHGFLDPKLAKKQHLFQRNLHSLQEEADRSDETFMQHFRDQYSETRPPSWAVCEVMTLGQLSKWFTNLRPMQTRGAIAAAFGVDERVLQSWLHHLTYVRNVCAHHSRL
ncbi:MAG TPA: Abi family protein, partial [Thermoanaerobaculia bacterium]